MIGGGLVWLALDGVGHPADAPLGSVWEQDLPSLRPLVEAGLALDATLGVPGLPQSGTGQACWLTGLDAVRRMGQPGVGGQAGERLGEHFGPHPGPTLQRLLRQYSLPVRLARAGGRLALVNYYAPQYFHFQARNAQVPSAEVPSAQGHSTQQSGRNRMGCFPYSFQAAGLPLNPPNVPLVRASLGLNYQRPWTPVQDVSELQRLGEKLAVSAQEHDLLVADLWFSDLIGHEGRNPTPPDVRQAGLAWLRRLDALVAGLLGAGARVVVSSDHGNLEDLTVKAHTLARVPFAGSGVKLGGAGDVVQAGATIAGWFGLDPVEDAET